MDQTLTYGDEFPKAGGLSALRLPSVPHGTTLWFRALLVATVGFALFLLDRLTVVVMDYWVLEQQGYVDVFWTNLRVGALLFAAGFALPLAAVALAPLGRPINPHARRMFTIVGVLFGLVGGYVLTGRYLEFLQLFGGKAVGEQDPVFGHDLAFYMFDLPAFGVAWFTLITVVVLGLVARLVAARLEIGPQRVAAPTLPSRLAGFLTPLSSPSGIAHVAAFGLLAALGAWLARFDLLWKDNRDSAIYVGAEALDVEGFLSHLNQVTLRVLLLLALTTGAVLLLARLRRRMAAAPGAVHAAEAGRRLALMVVAVVGVELAFAGLIALRNITTVRPNEPVAQLPYIQRHIDATLRGYGLAGVERVEFLPADVGDPLPTAAELMRSATMKNAPLWPGWVSYLERVLDPQHADRVLRTGGNTMVYGPVIDVFRAQQKLRGYYDFQDVDTVRYDIGGEKRLLVSAVRELPFTDPKPWITWWGQRMLLFTHSHGVVTATADGVRGEGEPVYLSGGIPAQSAVPELALANASVYYGEGTQGVMGFTNARNIKEFDRATDEGRQETVFPPSVDAGVKVDSLLKRLVIGWRSGMPFDVWFSGMIDSSTRLHYPRPPLDRLERIAPFLFYEANPFAVVHGGQVHWMVNGMTTSDRYPYSLFEYLGDKSLSHSPTLVKQVRVNYVRDSVKAVVDAYTGRVTLYRIADEPVINTWANIYPSLFRAREAMPEGLRKQMQYPRQLLHIQFDDIYYKYHMTDPMTFYNLEDMWDDADEVKGPILSDGESITFSVEPRSWIAETGGLLPAARDARERTQFVTSMVYTNEQALNLRAIPLVYQDGADYGRVIVLQVPKGRFYLGPEQADAAIDQDPDISEQISWWNRTGSEVVRGHTSTLIVGKDVIYVEPLFIRSKQNPVSQLKQVIVVFRGHSAAAPTLEGALEKAIAKAGKSPGPAPLLQVRK